MNSETEKLIAEARAYLNDGLGPGFLFELIAALEASERERDHATCRRRKLDEEAYEYAERIVELEADVARLENVNKTQWAKTCAEHGTVQMKDVLRGHRSRWKLVRKRLRVLTKRILAGAGEGDVCEALGNLQSAVDYDLPQADSQYVEELEQNLWTTEQARKYLADVEVENLKGELHDMQAERDALKQQRCFHQTRMHGGEEHGNCFATCVANLIGYQEYRDTPQWGRDEDWSDFWLRMHGWLLTKGLLFVRLHGVVYPKGMYLANGKTSRTVGEDGVRHTCIYKDGELFFDPLPNGNGLTDVESVEILVDVDWITDKIWKAEAERDRLREALTDAIFALADLGACADRIDGIRAALNHKEPTNEKT